MVRNKFGSLFDEDAYDRMVRNLQPPGPEEKPVIIDGTEVTKEAVAQALDRTGE